MRRKKKRRRYRTLKHDIYDSLEQRRLLAGDVFVFSNGDLFGIAGDELSNQIQVTSNEQGSLVVTGIEGTTVNGTSQPFVSNSGFSTFAINLFGGDDEVQLNGISVPEDLVFFGGGGGDRLVIENSFSRHFHLDGESGDDVFEFTNSFSGQSAYLFLSEGDDTVALNSFSAGRNFRIFGGQGDDTIVSQTVSASRDFSLDSGEGNDQVLFAGATTVDESASVNLGDGNDFFAGLPVIGEGVPAFNQSIGVFGGLGDDTFVFDENVDASFSVNGNEGNDSLGIPPSVAIDSVVDLESGLADSTPLLDAVFARLTEADIDPVNFGGPLASQADDTNEGVAIIFDSEPLVVTATSAPVPIDPVLTIEGDPEQIISSASVGISGIVAGQDFLTFTPVSGIAGSFDETRGVLTFLGQAPISDYETVLRSVQFQNTSADPVLDDRTINVALGTLTQTALAARSLIVLAP